MAKKRITKSTKATKDDAVRTAVPLFEDPCAQALSVPITEPVKRIGPFDIVKALFTNIEYVYSLTKETLKQNFFMVNRTLAKAYPIQAQAFNIPKVNEADVIKFWGDKFYKYMNVPGWVFAKPEKEDSSASDKKVFKPTSTIINEYCKSRSCSRKDIEAALRFFPDEMLGDLEEFDKINKTSL